MRNIIKCLLVTIVSLSPWCKAWSQNQIKHSKEKIYLQVDRPFYNQRDIVRFNLIILDAQTHLPTEMSDVAYVELIDPKGSVIKRLTLPIFDGTSKGDFELPDNGGLFKLKAYTTWSKNFDDIYLLEREITVQNVITTRLLIKQDFDRDSYSPGDLVAWQLEIKDLKNDFAIGASIEYGIRISGQDLVSNQAYSNQDGTALIDFTLPPDLKTTDVIVTARVSYKGLNESITRAIPIVLNNIDLNFYPEGGHVIVGHESVIAFEGINEFGKGADFRGIVLDDAKNIVTQFESYHQGMGAFTINYEAGRKYTAQIISPEIDKVFSLPEPQQNPVLTLKKQNENEIVLGIIGSDNNYWIEGFSKGGQVYERMIENSRELTISSKSLPVGITRFVLSTSEREPLSERMVFANKARNVDLNITTDKTNYLPGDEVRMTIASKDEDGNPVSAKFGLSIVDDQLISLADDRSDHILSYFHLTSELNTRIEEPIFYFDEQEKKADSALNFLMLVRGWSNYVWKDTSTEEIKYAPEKIRLISGHLLDQKNTPVQGEVYALEVSDKKRMIKIKTTGEGHFLIKNFNPASELYLFTKKPNRLKVDDSRTIAPIPTINSTSRYGYSEFRIEQFDIEDIETDLELNEVESFNGNVDLSLGGASELQEVIVTGYGLDLKENITGSVSVVSSNPAEEFSSMNSLQGKVAGIVITTKSIDPTIPPEIAFSQAKSLVSGNRSPLVVLNGIALSPSLSRHFINIDKFSPDEVDHMSFMDSPEARMQYGSKASNGIIFLETKSSVSFDSYSYKIKEGKYRGVILGSRKFSLVRDVYQLPQRRGAELEARKELGQLVYWNPEIITNEKGLTEISFYTNDQISNFKITAEGISNKGNVGRGEHTYSTSKPISLDIKLPNKVGYEDKIRAKLILTNETDKDLAGVVSIDGDDLEVIYDEDFKVNAHSRLSIPIEIISIGETGSYNLSFEVRAGKHRDRLEEQLEIFPVGFPTKLNHSGSNPNGKFKFDVSNVESNSLYTDLIIYPNVVADLESSAASLFRMPHGCFEQVSATTYPSILALRYLNSTGSGSSATKSTALSYIKNGYNKLKGYEVKGGGFEWFGDTPAHEGLSAFGLMEFKQMKKVYEGVNDKMISRTIDWLLSRKNGKGGFKQHAGKYGFAAASKEVNNAYLVYALSEVDVKDIEEEYRKSLDKALESQDDYRLALVSNAAYNLGDEDTYRELLSAFKTRVTLNGFEAINADHSLVRSYGKNLKIEVASLWALAYLKDEKIDFSFVNEIINFLLKNRSGSNFGSTQSTTLALQAITEYNVKLSYKKLPGKIEVWVNGTKAQELTYASSLTRPLDASDFSSLLNKSGTNFLELKYPHKETNLPYSFTVGWFNKTPTRHEDSPLLLYSELSDSKVKLNETIRMSAKIRNLSEEGLPMTIARFGIPGGLSLQPWQLKELQEKRVFDYYEIIDEDLVIYFKELGPRQSVDVFLDLKAEVEGTYLGRASSAYLYYNDDLKYWIPGVEVTVH